MLKSFFNYLSLLALLLFGAMAISTEISRDDYGFFDELGDIIGYGLLTILGCCMLTAWLRFFVRTRKRIAFLPISLPFILLASIISIKIYRSDRRDKPIFLSADFKTYSLDLRIDSTYCLSYSGNYSGYSRYGKFRLAGDTIYLDKLEENMGIKYPILLIAKAAYDTTLNTNTFIFQLNERRQIVDSSVGFAVTVDNRNKK